VEGESILTFQMEGAQICTPLVNSIEGPNISTNNNFRTFRQVLLLKVLNSTRIQKLDKKWAIFFYEANIPFNVVRHLTFLKVVKVTFEFETYYKPPSYHGLHTNLLKQSKVDVSKQVTERTWNSIHKYGTTICFNNWDNIA
jgi:hypothetical protein